MSKLIHFSRKGDIFMKGKICLLTAAAMLLGAFSVNTFAEESKVTAKESYSFNFVKEEAAEAVNLNDGTVPLYSKDKGYGFVDETGAMPARSLDTSKITWSETEGFRVTENGTGKYLSDLNSSNYNYGGLVFRVDVREAGGYKVKVQVSDSKFGTGEVSKGKASENTYVALSGMQAARLTSTAAWDAAGIVAAQHKAKWTDDNTWEFDFVTGEPYIEVEVEPTEPGTEKKPQSVGIKSISIEKIENNKVTSTTIPTVFVLGDSTQKTYTFEEAGMSGWGQIIGSMFDRNKVRVINYSMGGRSMKNMFNEGRFNDILLTAKPGDYIMLHSAHNDESTGDSNGPEARFGRGSTTAYYERWLNDIYIPAMLSRGITPILVTPMTRTSNGEWKKSGFSPDSPSLMKKAAENNSAVQVVDLYEGSKAYVEEIGANTANAIYMGVEAGELPSKTNSGSYANGHPDKKIDGTHYKEALAKVWCKIICEDIYSQRNDNETMSALFSYFDEDTAAACESGDWSAVFPEWTDDVTFAYNGDGTPENDPAYYRNQIEKLLQLGVMQKTNGNNFEPLKGITTNDFISSLCAVWCLDVKDFESFYSTEVLTREKMAAVVLKGYELRFGYDKDGDFNKPAYMTDYNGTTVTPDDPNYDPNLTGDEAQYYPLAGWGVITDKDDIDPEYAEAFETVYNLGLMRSEKGITRGVMTNGTEIEPKTEVTRAKAAKELWFLWVLGQEDVKKENQILTVTPDGINYEAPVYTPID